MNKTILLLIVFLLQLFSQITPIDSVGDRWPNMYPLELGNYWVFSESNGEHFNTERIVADTILDNGKNYFTMERFLDSRENRRHFIRLDSTGTLYQIREGIDDVEFPIMEFNVKVNDSILAINEIDYHIVTDIYLDEDGRIVIALEYSSDIIDSYDTWVEHIGLFSYGGEGAYNQLAGYFVGGVLVGDTINYTTVNEIDADSHNAIGFNLDNNYPNPFNSTTNISFKVFHPQNMKMTIYNSEGRLIKKIFENRFHQIGDYHYIWDGTNKKGNIVSSGIYICTVNGNLTKSIVLQLIK